MRRITGAQPALLVHACPLPCSPCPCAGWLQAQDAAEGSAAAQLEAALSEAQAQVEAAASERVLLRQQLQVRTRRARPDTVLRRTALACRAGRGMGLSCATPKCCRRQLSRSQGERCWAYARVAHAQCVVVHMMQHMVCGTHTSARGVWFAGMRACFVSA